MVRSAVVGFGAATMLALAGNMILGGQPTLRTGHPAAVQAGPVEAIQDMPAQVPAPRPSIVPAQGAPAASPRSAVSRPPFSRGRAQVHAAPPRAASAPLSQSLNINQLLPLAQSPAMPNVFSPGGTMSGNALLPGILQQFASPVAAPAPAPAFQPTQEPSPTVAAQPSPSNAAVNLVNDGGGRDAGDGQK
jgi:hypothetical protein